MSCRKVVSTPTEAEPTNGWFTGWRIVWVGAIVLAIGGSPQGGLPQFLNLGFREFHEIWDAGPVLGWVFGLLTLALQLLLLPLVGWAVDRWGARPMVLLGLALLGSGVVLYLGRQYVPMLILSLSAASIGSAMGTQLPFLYAVNNWFRRRRATAISIMLLPPAAVSALGHGLRPAHLMSAVAQPGILVAAAVFILAIAWPVSRMIRDRPEDWGQQPDGGDSHTQVALSLNRPVVAARVLPDYTWREALRTRAFWLMTLGAAVFSVAPIGAAYLDIDVYNRAFSSLDHEWVRWLKAALLVASVPLGGLLGDYLPTRRATFVFSLVQSISLVVMAFTTTLPMYLLAVALSGIGTGGGLPLTFAARGAYFGRRNFATITGLSLVLMRISGGGAGRLTAAVLVGLRGLGGSHTLPLLAIALMCAAGPVAFLFLGDPKPSPSQKSRLEP